MFGNSLAEFHWISTEFSLSLPAHKKRLDGRLGEIGRRASTSRRHTTAGVGLRTSEMYTTVTVRLHNPRRAVHGKQKRSTISLTQFSVGVTSINYFNNLSQAKLLTFGPKAKAPN